MAMLSHTLLLLLLLSPPLATFSLSDTVTPPRHILFFVIDDYGFADASYKNEMYNGSAAPPTPSLDALAQAGVRLESYYVNKLCSPTRTALLSGRYAYTIGMDDGVIINGDISVCMYVCMYVCVCVCVCMYVFVCVRTYVYRYV